MNHSIRRRLLGGLLAATASLWLLVIYATYHGANREAGSLFDAQLEQAAHTATRTLFGLPAPEHEPGTPEAGDQYRKNLVIQVWNDDGDLVVHSRNAPQRPLTSAASGFADSLLEGERWRTYTFHDTASGMTIRTGEPYRPRDYLTRHMVLQTMYPVLVGLPVVTLLIWFIVGRGLRPLQRLAAEVHRRDPDNLDPVDAPYAPAEVHPLVNEVNVLLDRLQHRIDKERHFVGDAAHELRTPLAGLKAQAEVALGARDDAERTRALQQILVGVERASHLVNQLLTLSRLDESGQFEPQPVDLAWTVRTVIRDSLAGADGHGVEIGLDPVSAGRARVQGNADALYVLVRNLVDNAVKYSPRGARVHVGVEQRPDGVLLSVRDQGPGIPPAERDKVFDRFHRRAGAGAYGSGLGLSIVRRVVELHHGEIVLGEAVGGGLAVDVLLPSAGVPPEEPPRRPAPAMNDASPALP